MVDALQGLSAVLGSWAVLTAVGYVVSRTWGLRAATSALAAMPVAFGLIAAFAFLHAVVGLAFSLASVAGAFVVAALLGLLVRRGLGARRRGSDVRTEEGPEGGTEGGPEREPEGEPGGVPEGEPEGAGAGLLPEGNAWLLLATTAVAAAVLLLATRGDLNLTSQTWDATFDSNAVRYVTDSGWADPWRVKDFSYGRQAGAYYPSGFHSVAAVVMQLLGSNAVLASNVTAALVAGAVWPSTAVLMVRRLVGTERLTCVVAGVAATSFWGMPWAPLGWGVLWATASAAAFSPLVVSALADFFGLSRTPRRKREALLLLLTASVAVFLFHPRGLLLAAPLGLLVWVGHLVRRTVAASRRGSIPRALVLAVLAVASLAAPLVALHLFDSGSQKLVAVDWPIEENLGGAILGYLVGGPNGTTPALLLAVLVAVGAVVALTRSRTAWIPLGYVVLAAVDIATSLGRSPVTTDVTRLWYGDRYRSAVMAPVLGILLATLAARFLSLRLAQGGRWTSLRRALAVGAVVLLALTSVVGPARYLDRTYYGAAVDPQLSLVSLQEVQFFRTVAAIVPAGEVILNNPQDGSALIYAYVDRRLAFYLTDLTPAVPNARALRDSLVREDPATACAQLREAGIRWVYNGGATYSNLAIRAAPAPGMEIPPGFPLTTLVAESGDARLYQVTGCG